MQLHDILHQSLQRVCPAVLTDRLNKNQIVIKGFTVYLDTETYDICSLCPRNKHQSNEIAKTAKQTSGNTPSPLFCVITSLLIGPDSSVGIATELRAGRSGIESWWGRDFRPVQTGPGAHPASCTMGTGSFPGVEAARSWG